MLRMFKIKELRNKLLLTFLVIFLVRFCSQVPVPGIDVSYFKEWFETNSNGAFNMLSALTGGSFEKFSVMALSISPYITASIIIQLLTVVFPSLEELQKDGDYGKKKIEKITYLAAFGLALVESSAMAIGFGRSGLLSGMTILRGISVIVFLTLGTVLVMVLGKLVDEKGIGKGISIILMANILSELPEDFSSLFEMFVLNKTIAKRILAVVIILAVTMATVVFVIVLNEAKRNIPVQYAKKMVGRKQMGGQSTSIPVKVNTASVIPVIFASSILSVPQLCASIIGKGYGSGFSALFLNSINQNNWFNPNKPIYTLGIIPYIVMIFFFAYFYVSISFNPMEIADNLKKQGGVVPGIRPGKPTEEYLSNIISRLTAIGTIGLLIVVMIPLFFSGMFNADVSFGGTSLIILEGVLLETVEQIDVMLCARSYSTFI